MARKPRSTFAIELKPAVETRSGKPYVFLEISQPVCFGRATLILSDRDIDSWEEVLKKARTLLEGR